MSDKLPKGWVKTTLGEIVCPGRSRVLPSEHPELPYIGLEHIESQTMRLLGKGNATDVRSSSILFEKSDVLYGKMRPYLNKVWVAQFPGMCSAEFLVFPYTEELNSAFVALRLNSDDFVNFANQQVSGERPRVDFKAISRFPIDLPPLPEQGRIVATLNMSLTRMYASESKAQRGSERLAKYRAAVLHAGVRGELTREWRRTHKPKETGAQLLQRLLKSRRARWEESELKRFRKAGKLPKDNKWKAGYGDPMPPKKEGLPKLPKEWTWTNLSQLKIYSIYGPRFARADYAKKGVAVLRTTDIDERGHVSLESCPKLPLSDDEYNKYKVEKGDLLITRTGSIGTLAIFNDTVRAIPGAYLLHYRLITPTLVGMVYTFLSSPEGQKKLWKESAGSGRQNLSAPGLENIAIPLPPLGEQIEIVREVERRQKAADRLAATLNRQLDRAHAARQSLLREAFAGHLVAQDQNDEPASLLLDRVRITREAELKKPKGKRMAKTKTQIARRPLLDVLRGHKKPITPEQLFREARFQPAEADVFYRELASLRKILSEKKPSASEAKAWPHRSHVQLELKER